jgi:23S rRNA U2552 (ribose-2'-O)-methylase RlmE/FtsJ
MGQFFYFLPSWTFSRPCKRLHMFSVEYPIPQYDHSLPHTTHVDSIANSHSLTQWRAQVGALLQTHGRRTWLARIAVDLPTWKTRRRAPASRAYFKLLEIVHTCLLPEPRRSLSLCEAPGGFVQCLQDVFPNAVCVAASLQTVGSPQFSPEIAQQCILRLGGDGDVCSASVQRELVQRVGRGSCDLVTSDGGFPADHDRLEAQTLPLVQASILVATECLAIGGTLVLKVFECNTSPSLHTLAWLCRMFRQVSILKPIWSRPTNSERYIVAREFEKFVSLSDEGITTAWLTQVRPILHELNAKQIDALAVALRTKDPRGLDPEWLT